MIANDLVKGILDNISIKVYSGETYKGPIGSTTRVLVLLCGSDFEKNTILKRIDQMVAEGCALTVVLSPNAEDFYSAESLKGRLGAGQVYTQKDRSGMERWLKSVQGLWCPNVTQSTLAKLSMGITDSLATCLIWRALAMEKSVMLTVNAAAHWTANLPEGHEMKKMLQDHLKKLEAFGAQLTTTYMIAEDMPVEAVQATSSDVRLVHEGNLLELVGTQKMLVLKKGQLITPAAKDLAKSRGIKLDWK